jgi:hypothetical protein
MTQALCAHMNNKTNKQTKDLAGFANSATVGKEKGLKVLTASAQGQKHLR